MNEWVWNISGMTLAGKSLSARKKNLSWCHFVYHKSHNHWPEIKTSAGATQLHLRIQWAFHAARFLEKYRSAKSSGWNTASFSVWCRRYSSLCTSIADLRFIKHHNALTEPGTARHYTWSFRIRKAVVFPQLIRWLTDFERLLSAVIPTTVVIP